MSRVNFKKIKKVYMIGIKGAGMSALAQVLKGRGLKVWGSDTKEKFFTDEILNKAGIKYIEGFSKKNIAQAVDLVVVSQAYWPATRGKRQETRSKFAHIKNPEVREVLKRKLLIMSYSEVVAILFNKANVRIAVCGSHGKSTTTAMIGEILEAGKLDPTVIVGTEDLKWRSNARVGGVGYFVLEADEYQEAFLKYEPNVLVITSIDYDHPDYFKDERAYKQTFTKLAQKVPPQGFIVAYDKDKNIHEITQGLKAKVIYYSLTKPIYDLQVPGLYNQWNAEAAALTAQWLGVDWSVIIQALRDFRGTRRRFETKKLEIRNLKLEIIDDYAHHPTEIRTVLRAARQKYPNKKIIACFQPHTYSRTKALFDNFTKSFDQADEVIIIDIYASAREKKGRVSAGDLAEAINKRQATRDKRQGIRVRYIPRIEKVAEYLKKTLKGDEVILTLGAGDIWKLRKYF